MDAACVRIRPLVDGETAPVLAVFAGLRARSRELRFLAPKLRLTPTDLRALTPLKWLHVNPYGTFILNMHERLPLEHAA